MTTHFTPSFLLLSNSPRRKELLAKAGFRFETVDNSWEEVGRPGESATTRVRRLSREKLEHFLSLESNPKVPVLSADTLLEFQGRPLEKPVDEAQAWEWYKRLAGKTHRVLTALTLWIPQKNTWIQCLEATKVRFVPWDHAVYRGYLETQEWKDAAGGYKIQESGERLVREIRGSWSNVVGLPIARFYAMLRQCQSLQDSPLRKSEVNFHRFGDE